MLSQFWCDLVRNFRGGATLAEHPVPDSFVKLLMKGLFMRGFYPFRVSNQTSLLTVNTLWTRCPDEPGVTFRVTTHHLRILQAGAFTLSHMSSVTLHCFLCKRDSETVLKKQCKVCWPYCCDGLNIWKILGEKLFSMQVPWMLKVIRKR